MGLKSTISSIGTCALGVVILLAVAAISVVFIFGAVWVGDRVLPWLMWLCVWAVGFNILILLPLAVIPPTRRWAGLGFYLSSYVFGLTGWFMGLLLTWSLWVLFAVILGLLIMGVGVVPIAIVATLFNGMWPELGMLVLTVVLTYGLRLLGSWLFESYESRTYASHRSRLLFAVWICLVCILLVSLGHYAWKYSPGPTSRTATDQAQLEDCAMAVVGCIHFSASDDPSDLASVASGKTTLKDMIQEYDKSSFDEICALVDESLRFERSLQKDIMAYMEESSRTSEASKFKISGRTRQILDKLPDKLRAFLEVNVVASEQLGSNDLNPPKNWRELMDKGTARIWAMYGQTYSELLGHPMPPPAG